jgi:hypothetical protein
VDLQRPEAVLLAVRIDQREERHLLRVVRVVGDRAVTGRVDSRALAREPAEEHQAESSGAQTQSRSRIPTTFPSPRPGR